MKVKVEGVVKEATLSEYRCRDFVSLSFSVDGAPVSLSDTAANCYSLVEANTEEKEMLRGFGFRIEGL
jgi:hypothetical protein